MVILLKKIYIFACKAFFFTLRILGYNNSQVEILSILYKFLGLTHDLNKVFCLKLEYYIILVCVFMYN